MANKAEKAARVAALKAEIADLQKDPSKNAAAITAKQAELKAAEDAPADDAEPDPKDPKDKNPDDGTEPEAVKIAKSAEATTHPHLVAPAIAANMNLAQFKAMCAAGAGKGRLAQHMQDSARLGPDGQAKPAATLDPKTIYARRQGGARKAS